MNPIPSSGPAVDACWRRIGIWGDASCPELERHVHCRNCPVYGDAALRNLERAVEADYRADWARELARTESTAPPCDAAALAFRVGAEWLAVPLALAASVAPLTPVHRVPHRGGALLGVVNVDGRLVPAVSLARMLDIAASAPPTGRHAFARLLVLAIDGQAFALPVDEVHGVIRHRTQAMRPPAASIGNAPEPLVAGIIGDGVPGPEAGLLAIDRLSVRLKELLR